MTDFEKISKAVSNGQTEEQSTGETVDVQTGEVLESPVRNAEGEFLFRAEWLGQYQIIDGPESKIELEVVREPNFHVPEDGNPRYIVNLKAIRRTDLGKVVELLRGKEYVRAEEIKPFLLTGTIWDGENVTLPMKGEFVNCNIDWVYSPAQDKDILGVKTIGVKKAVRGTKFDMSLLEG